MIFEEKGAFEDHVEEEVSEYEDRISENSESDGEFDEIEEEIGHQSVTGSAPGPAHQQQASQQPASQQPAPGPEPAPDRARHQVASYEIWISKYRDNNMIIMMQPGPTRMAVSNVQDIKSSFELFRPYSLQSIILDCGRKACF